MVLAGVLAWMLTYVAPGLSLHVPMHRTIAVCIAVLGIACSIGAKVSFSRAGTTLNPLHPENATSLVTSGLYRYSRNPMYVGQCLVLAGWCMWLDHALAWIAVVALAWFLTMFQIKPEERVLLAKFGEDYRAYCARVRRWF